MYGNLKASSGLKESINLEYCSSGYVAEGMKFHRFKMVLFIIVPFSRLMLHKICAVHVHFIFILVESKCFLICIPLYQVPHVPHVVCKAVIKVIWPSESSNFCKCRFASTAHFLKIRINDVSFIYMPLPNYVLYFQWPSWPSVWIFIYDFTFAYFMGARTYQWQSHNYNSDHSAFSKSHIRAGVFFTAVI